MSFESIRKKVIAHLEKLEEEEKQDKKALKKALYIKEVLQKANYPVGTIRTWKGKKYIKIAPGKWRPKYDSESRGAKMAISALKKKAQNCKDSQELLQLILQNKSRFSDDNGRPLPFVKELSDYISKLNDDIEEKKAAKKMDSILYERTESAHGTNASREKTPDTQNVPQSNSPVNKPSKESIASARLTFSMLTGILEKGHTQEIEHPDIGSIAVMAGETGKSGWGLKHIIEQRHAKDGKTEKEITAMIPLILDAASSGKINKENNKSFELEKNGMVAIIAKQRFGKDEKWILSGFENQNKNKEATDAINTVIALENYAPEFSYFRKQVGAVISSLDSLPQDSEKDNARRQVQSERLSPQKDTHSESLPSENERELPPSDVNDTPESKDESSKPQGVKDIRNKYESFKSVQGNKKTITLPSGKKIKCHYKLVEAQAPTASHDENTFSSTKGFPTTKDGKNVNDRDYQNDRDAQESVMKIANNFNSLALNSPPVVTKDGIVISGNNRTMSSKLAAKNGTDKMYLEDLKEMADEYGFDPEDLEDFKSPRLILEVDEEHQGEYTTEEFAQFNQNTKKTMSNVEKAVKLTKTLNQDKVQSIATELAEYETMGELYSDPKGSQKFVGKLIQNGIIGDNEKAQYLKSDGTLNDTGKDFVETVLVGSILNENNIRKLDGAGGKRIRQKLVRAILPLIENKGNGKEYSFNKELNDAVDIAVSVSKNHDKYPDVQTYVSQGSLFGDEKPDEITVNLAKIIHDEGEKSFSTRMKDLGAGLQASANGEMDIFLGGVESKESLMKRFLGIKKSINEMVSIILNKIA